MRVSFRDYWRLLAVYLRPQGRRTALLGGLLLAGIALQLLAPQLLRRFIDDARAGEELQTLLVIAGGFLGVALVTQAVTLVETWVAENVGWTATNNLRADLALHVLRLDPSFHGGTTPGALIERVDGDVAKLGNFFARFVVHVLGNGLLALGILILLFRIDWRIGAALATFAVVAFLVLNALRDVAVPHWAAARQASADLFGFVEERLAGTEDIRAAGAVPYVMRGNHLRARALLQRQQRAAVLGGLSGSTSVLLFAVGTAVALGIGATLFRDGAITLGTVYLIFQYAELLNRPIEQITRQMQDLQQAGASIVRVRELLDMEATIVDGPGASLPDGALAVDLDGVTFGYQPDEPVLRDVDIHLRPGEVLGLVGRTGSGKTSITRLLFRLYDPDQGAIRLGGVDIRQCRLHELRARVGMVTQEIQLFHASVRDNLTLFDETIPDGRIRDTLLDLGLGAWYDSLPEGLDTLLAAGGGGLSAGEAQLLAFARVFLRDPGLVILDEASSRLDPATEWRLERAVDRLLAGRTGIVIAHRLATVRRADTIAVLDAGRVVELGPRQQLADDPSSRFAAMLRTGHEFVDSAEAVAVEVQA
ncbi:MAG: ABC transporter ATP-binding protein/permease [Chloroflexota bacterium]|nr:ABC transporter ATP-binding protein/permease [Chloroflexota bacterium]